MNGVAARVWIVVLGLACDPDVGADDPLCWHAVYVDTSECVPGEIDEESCEAGCATLSRRRVQALEDCLHSKATCDGHKECFASADIACGM
jgi:hypothetical protein